MLAHLSILDNIMRMYNYKVKKLLELIMLKLEVIFKEKPINLSSGTSLFISPALDILEQFNICTVYSG